MDLREIPLNHRQLYVSKCTCGKDHNIMTQYDNDPEYYLDVYIPCDCGNFVPFDLPVN